MLKTKLAFIHVQIYQQVLYNLSKNALKISPSCSCFIRFMFMFMGSMHALSKAFLKAHIFYRSPEVFQKATCTVVPMRL